jgi:hypothetical protein
MNEKRHCVFFGGPLDGRIITMPDDSKEMDYLYATDQGFSRHHYDRVGNGRRFVLRSLTLFYLHIVGNR